MGSAIFGIWGMIFGVIFAALVQSPATVSNNLPVADSDVTTSMQPVGSSQSNSADVAALAKCLNQKGAKMYGAFWCPHCGDQKQKFADAQKYLPYVECDPKGENPQTQVCVEADIQAFPTWQMPDRQTLQGTQSLQDLAEWSGCIY